MAKLSLFKGDAMPRKFVMANASSVAGIRESLTTQSHDHLGLIGLMQI